MRARWPAHADDAPKNAKKESEECILQIRMFLFRKHKIVFMQRTFHDAPILRRCLLNACRMTAVTRAYVSGGVLRGVPSEKCSTHTA